MFRLGPAALFLIVAFMGFKPCSASASPPDLIDMLEENKVLTSEQAQELRSQKYSPLLEDMWFIGKVQSQAALVVAESNSPEEVFHTLELRRVRLGMGVRLKGDIQAVIETNLLKSSSPFLQKATLKWAKHPAFELGAGIDKPLSSLDENTSSAEIMTVEHAHISNTVAAPGSLNGVFARGKLKAFYYGLGAYTDQGNRNTKGELPVYLQNLQLGLKWEGLKVQGSLLRSSDAQGVFGSQFKFARMVGLQYLRDSFKVQTEAFSADGDKREVKGWYVMPSYKIWKSHQAVFRFESSSAQGRALEAPGRYAGDMPLLAAQNMGTDYRSFYLGWNWLLDDDSHKVMTGVETFELQDTPQGDIGATSIYLAWRLAI